MNVSYSRIFGTGSVKSDAEHDSLDDYLPNLDMIAIGVQYNF